MLWDIFCKVIDNHGDIGVCWRLAANLGARGASVRLWVDDPAALRWMAPGGAPGVAVQTWNDRTLWPAAGDVLVEAFGCDPPPVFVEAFARAHRHATPSPRWINLEYLSAESFVERAHGLPSPVSHGPGAGLVKHFFYPGFNPRTGGLLREPDLARRQAAFDREAWAARHGLSAGTRRVSLFCYEPPALADLLHQLAQADQPTQLLVTAGRAAAATRAALQQRPATGSLTVHWLPLMDQMQFDELLWACDFNFVRGEDSMVRALWADRPFAWHIYPQDDGAHEAKLQAFLHTLGAPPGWAQFMRGWNGMDHGPLPPMDGPAWQACATAFRDGLLAQDDLATALAGFVAKKR
ncbi:MAG: elongation factor P maturation arginine rhamnosyltransferase EarP [Ramlibacter sp.]